MLHCLIGCPSDYANAIWLREHENQLANSSLAGRGASQVHWFHENDEAGGSRIPDFTPMLCVMSSVASTSVISFGVVPPPKAAQSLGATCNARNVTQQMHLNNRLPDRRNQ
jgi:hypothetical protein